MKKVLALATVGLGLFAAQPVEAQWDFRATPYVWINGLNGDVSVGGGTTVPIEAGVSDFKFAPAFVFAGSGPRWGFMTDVTFSPGSARAGDPGEARPVDIDNFIGTALVTFMANETETSEVKVGVGARLLNTKAKVPALNGPIAEGKKTIVDPIASLSAILGRTVYFSFYGDLGGFGIGSRFTTQLYGALGYTFTSRTSAELGYRLVSHNYDETDELIYDVRQHGFMGAITIAF
jgi:hypothetical protein